MLWGSVLGLSVLCAVQGNTALMKAAENGDEALLNQLIAVNANVCAKNVIYCSVPVFLIDLITISSPY